jgi:hypothetical protein
MVALDGHRTAELRSLIYHQRVAEKLLADPAVLARARAKVEALLGVDSGAPGRKYAQGWSLLIDGPLHELVSFITSNSQEARDFRQSSPFAGALSPRERWQLWRQAAMKSSSPGSEGLGPR